jgi:phospholipid-translocating ATPase
LHFPNSPCADAFKIGLNRDKLINQVHDELKRDLILIGAPNIEDKLQEGVPRAIADLKRAGIKVWVGPAGNC